MADRWIVSTHWYTEHMTLARAKEQEKILSEKLPKKKFKVYRIKTSLEQSNAREVIEALEKRIKELETSKD